MLQPYLESLRNAERRLKDQEENKSWVIRSGLWPNDEAGEAAVLKLWRPHWGAGLHDGMVTQSGIWFSIWVDAEAIVQKGVHYNLHALKLRQLAGHSLESRKFALAFRAAFDSRSADWPGITMAFGPQTLFQGFAKASPKRVEEVALTIARRCMSIGPIVDSLLARGAKPIEPPLAESPAMACG